MTKIHRIVLLVVDTDDVGVGVRDMLESARYPNCCIAPHVMQVDTREVEWTDEHPLNSRRTQRQAFDELFGASITLESAEEQARAAVINSMAALARAAGADQDAVNGWVILTPDGLNGIEEIAKLILASKSKMVLGNVVVREVANTPERAEAHRRDLEATVRKHIAVEHARSGVHGRGAGATPTVALSDDELRARLEFAMGDVNDDNSIEEPRAAVATEQPPAVTTDLESIRKRVTLLTIAAGLPKDIRSELCLIDDALRALLSSAPVDDAITDEQILRWGQSKHDGTVTDAMARNLCTIALGLGDPATPPGDVKAARERIAAAIAEGRAAGRR